MSYMTRYGRMTKNINYSETRRYSSKQDETKLKQPPNKKRRICTERESSFTAINSIIIDILSDDILVHIMSFGDGRIDHKLISKHWKKLSEKNEEIKLKQFRKKQINSKQLFFNMIQYDYTPFENGEFWIIDPYRTQLNTKEIESGYQGPRNNLNFNDIGCDESKYITLLLHDGTYDFKVQPYWLKKVRFIGVGNNVIVNIIKNTLRFRLVLFQNIGIHSYTVNWLKLDLYIGGHLQMIDCEIKLFGKSRLFGGSLLCSDHNKITFKQCTFLWNDSSNIIWNASMIGSYRHRVANVALDIIGCTFQCFGNDIKTVLIAIDHINDIKCGMNIRMIGNVFRYNKRASDLKHLILYKSDIDGCCNIVDKYNKTCYRIIDEN